MKKIEDYLHFYIGSDVMHSDGSTSKLIGVQHPDTIIIVHNDYGVYGEGKYGSVKLLLRPLSSMTEEEAIQLAYIYSGDMSLVRIKGTVSNYWYFKCFNDDEHILVICTSGEAWYTHYFDDSLKGSRNVINAHDATRFLLSKGFDIFGLIDANLALDATKIEKV